MVALKGFNVRDDEAVRYAIRRSNIVVNCIGAERETWNYDFEEVHVDIARASRRRARRTPSWSASCTSAACPRRRTRRPSACAPRRARPACHRLSAFLSCAESG